MKSQKQPLSISHPELAGQWHSTKNGSLTPDMVSAGSDQKVWWQCHVTADHEWDATIGSRSRGTGCPCCGKDKVVPSNCLATTRPKLAEQWHPTKNGDLTPHMVKAGSNKKVWWKCHEADDHEWEATIWNRSRGRGCPCCGNDKVVRSNSLATTHPELAEQWHPTKNGDLTPNLVTAGSGKKVWWKCLVGDDHEWQATIISRSRTGCGCNCCHGIGLALSTCLATTHPDLAKQWHPIKNGNLTPFDVTFGRRTKIWWKCPKGDDHEWQSSIFNRSNGDGCPCCRNFKVVRSNSLATTHPELAEQWHPTKNGDLTPNLVTAGSGKKIWWKCLVGDDHEWQTTIISRSRTGCPYCNESRGEASIVNNLNSLGLAFKRQHKIPGCIYKRHLKFDFAVYTNYQKLFLIEYQGIQHYEAVAHWGGKTALLREQNKDKIKVYFANKELFY